MTEKEEIDEIRIELLKRSVLAKDFLARADVSTSSWHRIKNGKVPNGATMNRLRSAFAEITSL